MSSAPAAPVPSHVHPVRVLYADTDLAGVVYHANYLRYLEAARAELFRARGLTYAEIERRGFVWPVVEVSLRYRRPCRYDDLLEVRLFVTELTDTSARLDHQIVLPSGQVACDGFVRLVCTSRDTGRPTPIPDDVRALVLGT